MPVKLTQREENRMPGMRHVACVATVVLLLPATAADNASAADNAGAGADYPNKPLRFIVPFPTGSGPDANARVLAAALARPLGQQVLIDNRPGASGIIGTQLAAKSAPDGYTLVFASASVWYGPAVPAAAPRGVITRLHTAIGDTLKLPEVANKLTDVSAGYIIGNTPEEFTAHIRAERAKWGKVIKQAGVKLEL
jgi:tripartite-type tricarboxylate transporter receptor subunit TctC